jgi:hypothetical protein
MKIGLSVSSTPSDFKIAQSFTVKSLALAFKPSWPPPNETTKTDASGYWNFKKAGSLEHRTLVGAGGIGAKLWLVICGAGGGLLLVGARYLTGVFVFSIVLERVCTGRLLAAAAGSSLALADFGWFVFCAGKPDEDDDDSFVASRKCSGDGAC